MNIGLGFFLLDKVYDKVRPDYDFDAISKVLIEEFSSDKKLIAAEIGAGSGKFTSVLLKSLDFQNLFIVEPEKAAMEEHKKKFVSNNSKLHYVNTYSDSTHLENHSIDCIFVSQAFHFFPIKETRDEFLRILKPNGKVFIFGRFLLDSDVVSRQFISITRFGNRLNGYKNNIQAYEENNIKKFFGKKVDKKIISNEYLSYTKEELVDNVRIRINSSGDENLINNQHLQVEIINSINNFFVQYKDKTNKVRLEYQSFYFCSDIVIYENSI